MMTIGDDMDQRNGLLVELIPAGFDPRQIEDLIDQIQEVYAGVMDVSRIFLVDGDRMGAEDLAFHHFRKPKDGVQRRPQLVAHLRQEPRLGDVG